MIEKWTRLNQEFKFKFKKYILLLPLCSLTVESLATALYSLYSLLYSNKRKIAYLIFNVVFKPPFHIREIPRNPGEVGNPNCAYYDIITVPVYLCTSEHYLNSKYFLGVRPKLRKYGIGAKMVSCCYELTKRYE